MKVYHIKNWCFTGYNPYSFSKNEISLFGLRIEDNNIVITSPIVYYQFNMVKTASGSIYYLEDIDPRYLNYLKMISKIRYLK